MYGTQVIKDGKVVAQSRNLRGMRDYARKHPVERVDVERDPTNDVRGVLRVLYADGASSVASFASYNIMVDWVRNRRSWRGADIRIAEDIGYLTKPGIIAGGAK